MCNTELFVSFTILVSAHVLACLFATRISLVALGEDAIPALPDGVLNTFSGAPPICGAPSI